MNMNDYESQLNAAMENCNYDSDDIILGDIDHDKNSYESEMDVLLEALDMLPEAEFTAAMESMTDDEINAIYNAAVEAGGGNGGSGKNKPKPNTPIPTSLGAVDDYSEKLNGGKGGLLGKISDYLATKGESSLSTGMMNKIKKTGTDAGNKDTKRIAELMKNGYTKDEALRRLAADQKDRAKGIYSEMKKTGVKNPFAYLAANRALKNATTNAYKDAAKKEYMGKLAADARKQANADFDAKHPELAGLRKLNESREKEDKTDKEYRNKLDDAGKAVFDKYMAPATKLNRARADLMRDGKNAYDAAIAAGYSEKEAKKKFYDEDKVKRDFEIQDTNRDIKEGFKQGFGALGKTIKRETPTFQAAGKSIAKGTKHVAGKLSNAAKSAWKELTASTGSEYGFDYCGGDDIDVTLEAVYESGNTIYTSTLEDAYYAARIIASMDDDEIDEMMSELSATECTDLITSLNYFNDIVDADIQRDIRLEFDSAIENAFITDDIGYSDAEEALTLAPRTKYQASPTKPVSNPASAQKPSIGTRIKNFITGNGSDVGFKERVASAFKNARDTINKWWSKKPNTTTSTTPTTTNNSNDSNNNEKSDTAANDSDGG